MYLQSRNWPSLQKILSLFYFKICFIYSEYTWQSLQKKLKHNLLQNLRNLVKKAKSPNLSNFFLLIYIKTDVILVKIYNTYFGVI